MMDEQNRRDFDTEAKGGFAQDRRSDGAIAGRNVFVHRQAAAQEAQTIADNTRRLNDYVAATGAMWRSNSGGWEIPESARWPTTICGLVGAIIVGVWAFTSGSVLEGIIGICLGFIAGGLLGQVVWLGGAVVVGVWRAVAFLGWRGIVAIGALVAGGFVVRELSKTGPSSAAASRVEFRSPAPVRTPPVHHLPSRPPARSQSH